MRWLTNRLLLLSVFSYMLEKKNSSESCQTCHQWLKVPVIVSLLC